MPGIVKEDLFNKDSERESLFEEDIPERTKMLSHIYLE